MGDIPDWVRQAGDEITHLESLASHEASRPIREALIELLRQIVEAWQRLIGGSRTVPDSPGQRAAVSELQDQVVLGLAAVNTTQAAVVIRREVERAATLGAHLGARQAGITPVPVSVPTIVRNTINELDETMSARLEVGQRLAQAATTLPRLQQAVAAGMGAAQSAERAATWATMYAANRAVIDQANAAGQDVLWVAERNACLYCLAQSGHLAVDGAFNAARSFGAGPLAVWPDGADLDGPPRHVNCRCHLVVYAGHVGPGLSLPDALQREAQRSVVLGLALPSESQTKRAKAAQKFVDAGKGAPKTVLARTRRELLAGTFTTRSR